MVGLTETSVWEDEIYQIEQTDAVVAGEPNLGAGQGIPNVPNQQLANRTQWLKGQLAATAALLSGYVPTARMISTGAGLTGGGALSANRTLAVSFANLAEAKAGNVATKAMNPLVVKQLLQAMFEEQGASGALLPIGTPIFWTSTTIPAGFLEQGSVCNRADYPELWAHAQSSGMYDETGVEKTMFGPGDGATTFELPDWSDDVIRVWGNGSGIEPGRALGSWQDGQVGPHAHDLAVRYWERNNDGGSTSRWDPNSGGTEFVSTEQNTGVENRMRNTALMMIIRAY